jgi:hypothetical protein
VMVATATAMEMETETAEVATVKEAKEEWEVTATVVGVAAWVMEVAGEVGAAAEVVMVKVVEASKRHSSIDGSALQMTVAVEAEEAEMTLFCRRKSWQRTARCGKAKM